MIPWLDLLRTLAIVSVIAQHCISFGFVGIAAKALYWGWTGVDLFFVLSGFLIGRQLWKELKSTGTIRIGAFLMRRGMRIWPLYFATVSLYYLGCIVTHVSTRPLLSDAFFLSNYLHSLVRGGWSLSTEEQFYIIAPVSLCLFRFAPRRALALLPALWLAILPVLRHQALAHHPGQTIGDVIYFPIHLHSDGLAAGLLISWASVFYPNWWQSKRAAISLPVVLVVGGMLLRFWSKDTLSYTALAFIFAGLILFGLRFRPANRIASWRGFYVMARLSFGAYLNHLVLIELMPPGVSNLLAPFSHNPLAFVSVVLLISNASLLLAFITYALIERPGLVFRDKWQRRGTSTEIARPSFQVSLYNLALHTGQSQSPMESPEVPAR